jgi:hypothetical protein
MLTGIPCIQAQPKVPTFWQDIRPILRKHCTVCHSAKNLKEPDVSGGLALDSFDAARKGTKHPIFEPGKGDKSVIVQLLTTNDKAKRMPLDAPALSKENIDLIRRWIDAGAKEGVRPDDTPDPIVAKKTGKRRRLDVVLPTTTIAPAGTLGKTAGKLELSLKVGPLAPVAAVAFSPDNKLLAAGAYGQVTIWDLTKGSPVKTLTNVLGAVNDLKFSPDGTLLAVSGGQPSAKGDLRIYHVADWKLIATMRGHDDVVFCVAFSPDGKKLASASFDKSVRLWKINGDHELTIPDHSDFVYAVAFSPDGTKLASASKDRTVKLVDVRGKSLFTFSGMDQDVLAVAYSPDGKQVVSSGFEPGLSFWNPATGEKIKTQGGHSVAVHELAFSKDGKRLVSAGGDRTARIWDGATGAPIKVLSVGSMVYAIAISSNNKLIATGSFDGLVRVWEEASGRQLVSFLALPAEGEQVDWLAFTPEGYAAASAKIPTEGRWLLAGQPVADPRVWTTLQQPEQIARALRGESVAEMKFAAPK